MILAANKHQLSTINFYRYSPDSSYNIFGACYMRINKHSNCIKISHSKERSEYIHIQLPRTHHRLSYINFKDMEYEDKQFIRLLCNIFINKVNNMPLKTTYYGIYSFTQKQVEYELEKRKCIRPSDPSYDSLIQEYRIK